MLFHGSKMITPFISGLNVMHYSSFRALGALITALILSFVLGSWFIKTSQRLFRARTREHAPSSHQLKGEMPTMGGVFMLMVIGINAMLWCNLYDVKMWLMLATLFSFGLIGFIDDWHKIVSRKGISSGKKAMLQFIAAAGVGFLLIYSGWSTQLSVPFFKGIQPDLGWWYLPWIIFIMIGSSNAVNLTDGLDGLAIGSLIPNFSTYAIVCFLASNLFIADYLHIPYGACGELVVLGVSLLGASIGFLWYNAYPAQIFMGDVGSLALGAGLAFMAIASKQELLLPISGILFVVEAASVIIQVVSFKWFGRRIFKMAPIHHHFELLGWPEAKISIRFAIITFLACLIALMTLKIR